MNFLIISHADHKKKGEDLFSYAPYVREMNLWLKNAESINIVAPKVDDIIRNIDLQYNHDNINFKKTPPLQFTSLKHALFSVFLIPKVLITLVKACKNADHIHLRCPGNIGLLGCLVQVAFPKKNKTAKYAGNWDPKSKQPLSYRMQKWILRNTFLTKNMQVLVYGHWKNQTQNIKPFFTASFSKKEIEPPVLRIYNDGLKFVFIGGLVEGKRPLLAIQIVEAFIKQGKQANMDIFGDGILRNELQNYIYDNGLEKDIKLRGNQKKESIKKALKHSHFLILPSKSEGWPKAVAEAMFFGVIPISTSISCVPHMLGGGARGIIIEPDLNKAVRKINNAIINDNLQQMSQNATHWSQKYTLDDFEQEIKNLLTD